MTKIIDASAIILKPKQEFFDWLHSDVVIANVNDDEKRRIKTLNIVIMRANSTVIAMPRLKDDMVGQTVDFLEKNADAILEAEFSRYGVDVALRPDEPVIDLLSKWFDISYHGRVYAFDD